MANPSVSTRIFLVGCPRSGTTLLQCLLTANSQLASFPETHFYERIVSGKKLPKALGLARRRARHFWGLFVREINHPEMEALLPRHAIFLSQYSAAYVRILDGLSLEQGRSMWLEKTPGHLRRIPEIQRLVPNAKFVHILRNGEDAIASMFHVASKYGESWAPWYGTLDQCIDRWTRDIQISQKHAGQPGHVLIRYEELLADPEKVLNHLCQFIGIPFESSMLTEYARRADDLIYEGEAWKSSVREPIWREQPRRFREYLDEGQRQHVRARVPGHLVPYLTPDPRSA